MPCIIDVCDDQEETSCPVLEFVKSEVLDLAWPDMTESRPPSNTVSLPTEATSTNLDLCSGHLLAGLEVTPAPYRTYPMCARYNSSGPIGWDGTRTGTRRDKRTRNERRGQEGGREEMDERDKTDETTKEDGRDGQDERSGNETSGREERKESQDKTGGQGTRGKETSGRDTRRRR